MAPFPRLVAECDTDAERQTGSLAGLAVTLLLVVVGLYLIEGLRTQAVFQDCVLSGRAACDAAFPS